MFFQVELRVGDELAGIMVVARRLSLGVDEVWHLVGHSLQIASSDVSVTEADLDGLELCRDE